jgi:4,5-DOPA dioxygenase extradiol
MSERFINPVFIGHGSPMNAIAQNRYTRFLGSLGESVAPEAILVVSAHWRTKGTRITGAAHPEQIYDFYGFPDELYNIKYAPPGMPDLAAEIAREIPGIEVDPTRGIDHAGWAVAIHMYPEQNIPILQLSLEAGKTEREHFELGKALRKFAERGILVIGSGNVVHNLRDIDFDDGAKPFKWSMEADGWVKEKTERYAIDELIDYKKHFPDYLRALPTDEHYLPLLYILGMKNDGERVTTLFEEIQNGSISMRSLKVG